METNDSDASAYPLGNNSAEAVDAMMTEKFINETVAHAMGWRKKTWALGNKVMDEFWERPREGEMSIQRPTAPSYVTRIHWAWEIVDHMRDQKFSDRYMFIKMLRLRIRKQKPEIERPAVDWWLLYYMTPKDLCLAFIELMRIKSKLAGSKIKESGRTRHANDDRNAGNPTHQNRGPETIPS